MVGNTVQTRKRTLTNVSEKPCSECGGRLRSRTITQEYEREGIRVRLAGVRAWVCGRCGETYFMPGGADRLAKAARALLALAMANRPHRGRLTARIS